MEKSIIFTPCTIGNLTLKNRTIRSAAFENMCYNNMPSEDLFKYHTDVAKGGIGMTTIAYASINRSGVSFDGQLRMNEEIIPDLRRLTDAIHKEGAKVSIQLGHCGNMTHRSTCGEMPVGASKGFNLYSPTFHRKLSENDIQNIVADFGKAVEVAMKAGFDCVEIHAGHGYLISQFLSPYTNRRRDKFGGSLENRMRFMELVINEVKRVANGNIAIIVKTNMYDGFRRGLKIDDCIKVAKKLEELGIDALVLTAGFVSRAPMEVMRGSMPHYTLAYYMDATKLWWLKIAIRIFGKIMIPKVEFHENYFLETAKTFRKNLKIPLIYVGGITSKANMEDALTSGFVAVQMARVLVNDTQFINKIAQGLEKSECKHSNYCIGRMYTKEMKCHNCIENLPKRIVKEIKHAEENY